MIEVFFTKIKKNTVSTIKENLTFKKRKKKNRSIKNLSGWEGREGEGLDELDWMGI